MSWLFDRLILLLHPSFFVSAKTGDQVRFVSAMVVVVVVIVVVMMMMMMMMMLVVVVCAELILVQI
jgi:hypothetical protein